MTRNLSLKFETILERDIDLLLLEEFHCSRRFQNWFVQQIFGTNVDQLNFLGALHSVTHAVLGESDLEVEFQFGNGCKTRVLIENKIDAMIQPDQGVRYGMRGTEYLAKKLCDRFITVLICPLEYLEGLPEAEEFDVTLTYEAIRDWFLSDRDLGIRGQYKASVITAGIEEARRGYHILVNDKVSNFWTKYWALANSIAPELGMNRPSAKPERSSFVAFKPVGLPDNMRIIHKLRHGNVDLEFSGMSQHILELKSKYEKCFKEGMTLARTGKSATIRIKVPIVETLDDFDRQADLVEHGIVASKKLYDWILDWEKLVEHLSETTIKNSSTKKEGV